jgi:hypothetical protein|tara:strand:- start:360 stop:527 length:168 start_codon:yes stop_codon:yes gene_type:complete
MPFKSEKQRRYLFKNKPVLAKKWAAKYGSKVKKVLKGYHRMPDGSIMKGATHKNK